jgi:hypothetical protein
METLIIFSPAADPFQPLLNNKQHSPSNILKEKKIQMFSLNFFRVARLRFFGPWSVAVLVGFGISVIGFGFSRIFG